MNEELAHAMDLVDQGELDQALAICNRVLHLEPDHYVALNVLTAALAKSGDKTTIAYHLGKRLTELDPKRVAGWINYGKSASDLWEIPTALRAYRRALQVLDQRPPKEDNNATRHNVLVNISAAYIDISDWKRAEEYARKALRLNPDSPKAKANVGFAQLAQRNWSEGWANYHACLGGTEWRPATRYGDEPEWDGKPCDSVVFYGEQGIGDEICFASMVPDAAKLAGGKVILDVDRRLEGLFKRSFPDLTIYGTRNDKAAYWETEDRTPGASLALGQLGEFVRLEDSDFDVSPYLVADPVRAGMWELAFSKIDKPKIGIAWTGGIPRTGARFRRCTLEDYLPMFKAIDAHWVSLEYKASHEVADFKEKHPEVDLWEYPFATLTKDYDDTAALVSQLDCVVSVPTAVWHLAGALGTPVVAMKGRYQCWKTQAGIPFHPVMSFVDWRLNWQDSITRAIPKVQQCIEYSSATSLDSPSVTPSLPIRSNGTAQSQLPASP